MYLSCDIIAGLDSQATPLIAVGSLIAIIGSMILFNLRSLKKCFSILGKRMDKQEKDLGNRMDKQEKDIKENTNKITSIASSMSACKLDCERTFVPSEAFLRETGFTRRSLDKVSSLLAVLSGKLTVIEQLPKICGDISRSIISEMKKEIKDD